MRRRGEVLGPTGAGALSGLEPGFGLGSVRSGVQQIVATVLSR